MKRITGIVTVVALAVIVSSCSKRDHTCSCTYRDQSGVRQKSETTVKGTRKEAQNACGTYQASLKTYVKNEVTCLLQ